jgi:hypothetical protein
MKRSDERQARSKKLATAAVAFLCMYCYCGKYEWQGIVVEY